MFRPPAHASLLCTYVGVGVQLFGMLLVTMVFALLGFLSPANRGGLMTAMVMMFVLMGLPGGYAAGRLYKQFRGEEWRAMTARTALLFPGAFCFAALCCACVGGVGARVCVCGGRERAGAQGEGPSDKSQAPLARKHHKQNTTNNKPKLKRKPGVVSAIFIALDLMIWGQKSSGAVPIGTLVAIAFLWLCVSAPLVFVGSYFGFKRPALEDPVRTNKIPRQVPEQPWYMHAAFSCLVGGVLPFGAVFIELFFILTSVWLHQFYYLFGFIALVFVILCVTCAEITVVLCYFQLCAEDYDWWWRAYFTSGASAGYLFAYSAFYFYSKLDITKLVPMLLYFGYMAIVRGRGRERDGWRGGGVEMEGG